MRTTCRQQTGLNFSRCKKILFGFYRQNFCSTGAKLFQPVKKNQRGFSFINFLFKNKINYDLANKWYYLYKEYDFLSIKSFFFFVFYIQYLHNLYHYEYRLFASFCRMWLFHYPLKKLVKLYNDKSAYKFLLICFITRGFLSI